MRILRLYAIVMLILYVLCDISLCTLWFILKDSASDGKFRSIKLAP